MNFKSISSQMMAVSTFCIVLFVFVTGYFSLGFAKQIFKDKLIDHDLKDLVRLKASKIAGELNRGLEIARILSDDPDLIDWIESKSVNKIKSEKAKDKLYYISNHFRYAWVYASSAVTDDYYLYWRKSNSENPSFLSIKLSDKNEQDKWFYNLMNSNLDLTINISSTEENDRESYAFINVVVTGKNKGVNIGSAGVGIRITDFIKEYFGTDEFGGKSWLIKKDGTIVATHDVDKINRNIKNVVGEVIGTEILQSEKQDFAKLYESDFLGSERIFFACTQLKKYNQIENLDLVVVYAVPYDSIMRHFIIMRYFFILSAVIGAVITLVIFWKLSIKIINPIKNLSEIAEKITGGDLTLRFEMKLGNEIGKLGAAFNSMTESLSRQNRELETWSKTLEEQVKEKTLELEKQNKSMKLDLEMGQKVQSLFLSKINYQKEWFEVYARNLPSRELGGDFFRLYEKETDSIRIFIGDVSGKGVGSSLITSSVISYLDQLQDTQEDPELVMAHLNKKLAKLIGFGEKGHIKYYVTAASVFIERQGEKTLLHYINAGHLYPVLLREGKYSEIVNKGFPLGIAKDAKYKVKTIELLKNDTLYLMTDGFIEQANTDSELYGFDRMKSFLEENGNLSLNSICEKMFSELEIYSGSVGQQDDRTVVGIRIF